MVDIVQFSRNIRKRGSQIENGSVVLVRKAAKTVLKALCYGSPADKGVMRSNYRVSVGGRATAMIGAYSPGKKLGMGERANAGAAYKVGSAKINGLINKANKSVTISNNVPYLDKVNGGSVKQTSPGFVERAVALGAETVPQFKFFGTIREEDE